MHSYRRYRIQPKAAAFANFSIAKEQCRPLLSYPDGRLEPSVSATASVVYICINCQASFLSHSGGPDNLSAPAQPQEALAKSCGLQLGRHFSKPLVACRDPDTLRFVGATRRPVRATRRHWQSQWHSPS